MDLHGQKMVENNAQKKKKHELRIYMKDGTANGYRAVYPVNNKVSSIRHFYSFYNWFYLRKTPYYTFEYQHHESKLICFDVLIRSEIKRIEFVTTEVTETAKD